MSKRVPNCVDVLKALYSKPIDWERVERERAALVRNPDPNGWPMLVPKQKPDGEA